MSNKSFTHTPKSTFIKDFTYSYLEKDEKRISEKLLINFTDGSIVEYSPPIFLSGPCIYSMQTLYDEMVKAESIGKFWHKYIKNILQYKKIR